MKLYYYLLLWITLCNSFLVCTKDSPTFGFFLSSDLNETEIKCTFGPLFGRLDLALAKTFNHTDENKHSDVFIQLIPQSGSNIADRTLNILIAQSGQVLLDRTVEEIAGQSTKTQLLADEYIYAQEDTFRKLYTESTDPLIKQKIEKLLLVIEKSKQNKANNHGKKAIT